MNAPRQIPESWIDQIALAVEARLAGRHESGSSCGCDTDSGSCHCESTAGITLGGSRSATTTPPPSGGGYDSAPVCTTPGGCQVPGFENGPNPERMALLKEYGVARIACPPGVGQVDAEVAALIDHTQLKPEATEPQILDLCHEAHCHGFATVCVQPYWVPLAASVLRDSRVRVCTVVGFPHGANCAEVKAYETQVTVAQGAREVDMVIPVGALKSGDSGAVAKHIRAVVHAAIPGVVTKVILENTYLTDEEKVLACQIARDEGAHFVKTSTGFGPSGATLDDIRLMREVVGPTMGVKAAGGIRDQDFALQMVAAGATRIGASASIQIASGS